MNWKNSWKDIQVNGHTGNKCTLVGFWQDICGYYLDSVTGAVWCHRQLGGPCTYIADSYEKFKQKLNGNLRGELIA